VNEAAPDLVVLLSDYVDPVIPRVEPLEPERVSTVLGDLAPPNEVASDEQLVPDPRTPTTARAA